MKILLIKFMSLGDAVMSSVGFRMLYKAFPKAQFTILTLNSTAPIFENCSFIDRIIAEPQKSFWDRRNYFDIVKRVIKWRKERYKLAVSFHAGKAPNILVSMLNAEVKIIPGRADLKWLLASDGKSFKPGINHYLQAYPEIAKTAIRAIGGKYEEDIPYPQIYFNDDELIECELLLSRLGLESRNYISLFPGGGVNPGNQVVVKRYPRMAEAIEYFHAKCRDTKIVMLGSETDKEAAEKIKGKVCSRQVLDLVGKTTIRQFINIINKSGLLITTDSSALHIGQACRIPIVAIFGPTDPKEFVDPRADVKVIAPQKAKPVYTGKFYGNDVEALKTFKEILPEQVGQTIEKTWKEINENFIA